MADPPNLAETINDTEGLVWGLYYHLWKKTHKGLPCPDINIPHTVLYQDSTPVAWYFTSVKDNKIYRKKKSNVTGPLVWDAFSSGVDPKIDACAWFSGNMTLLSSSPKKVQKKAVRRTNDDEEYELYPEEDEKEPASFEYLAHPRVQNLTYPGQYTVVTEQIYDGMLQKFVIPREAQDSVIRAVWSPTACVCERRVNRYDLSDERQPLSDRIASFQSNNFWLNTHQPLPAGTVLVQRLSHQCDTIVHHLREVTAGRVSVARMELFFKVDAVNRIWLLYCNSLRLDRTAPGAILDHSPSTEQREITKQYTLKDPSRQEEDTRIPVDHTPFICVMTGKQCPGAERVDVSYKVLMQAWFAEAAQLAMATDRMQALDNIPPAIRRDNPNITREHYLRMRSQPMFLLKTAPVCKEAAAALIPAAMEDLVRTITRPNSALADSAAAAGMMFPPSRVHTRTSSTGHHHYSQHHRSAGKHVSLSDGLPGTSPNGLSESHKALGMELEVLYEPGASIPVALLPKSRANGNPGTAGSMHTTATLGASSNKLLSPRGQQGSTVQGSGLPGSPLRRQPQGTATAGSASPSVAGRQGQGRTASPGRTHMMTASPRPTPGAQAARTSPPRQVADNTFSSPAAAGAQGQQVLGDVTLNPNMMRSAPLGPNGTSPPALPPPLVPRSPSSPARAPAGSRTSNSRVSGSASKAGVPEAQAAAPHRRTSHVSNEDLRTLKELSDAYASAEAVTQDLLAQAQQLLSEPPPVSSRPGSREAGAGNAAAPAGGAAAAGRPGSNQGTPSKGSGGGSSSRPGSKGNTAGGSSRPGSGSPGVPRSGSAQRPSNSTLAAALGPKPGGIAAGAGGATQGLTSDEAALLNEALNEA